MTTTGSHPGTGSPVVTPPQVSVPGAGLRPGDQVQVPGFGTFVIVRQLGPAGSGGLIPFAARNSRGRRSRLRLAGDYRWLVVRAAAPPRPHPVTAAQETVNREAR